MYAVALLALTLGCTVAEPSPIPGGARDAAACAAVTQEDQTEELDESADSVNLVQNAVLLESRRTIERQWEAGELAMHAEDREALRKNPYQRVWFLCRGGGFQPQSDSMEGAGITSMAPVKCTNEMTVKGLCCAPWARGLKYTRSGGLDLKAAQHADGPNAMKGPGASQASLLETGVETALTLCTQDVSGATLAKGKTMANMPVKCFQRTLTECDLKGGDGFAPGEKVLQARIEFLVQQGIPASDIPLCTSEEVVTGGTCPSGDPPARVKEGFVDGLSKPELMQAVDEGGESASFGFGGMGTQGNFVMTSTAF